ncbi:hypothetical protein Rsph17029_0079 [Rhodobacter sphaeroides ATCC 17029]|nr:hypothetical protein Rsph17029_0079 [Cereibacter sphaeroides ATCC 17029]
MPSYRSNVTHKTVKLSPTSSPKLVSRYASGPPSKRPNRPHIPSSSSMSKSTEDKTNRDASQPAIPSASSSRFPKASRQHSRLSTPSPSPFRFGEALSREPQKNPQEEK